MLAEAKLVMTDELIEHGRKATRTNTPIDDDDEIETVRDCADDADADDTLQGDQLNGR